MDKLNYTANQIRETDAMDNVFFEIQNLAKSGNEWATKVISTIPADIEVKATRMREEVFKWARQAKKEDVEKLLRAMGAGYIRNQLRLIWRNKI